MDSGKNTDNIILCTDRNNRPGWRPVIAIAGADRYMDYDLLLSLMECCDVIVLAGNRAYSRNVYKDQTDLLPHMQRRQCDLFSLQSATRALQGADYAIYLAHSVMSQARLTQASLADMSAIQADIFARSACTNGIRHIVCLNGLDSGDLRHKQHASSLASMLATERILSSYGVPVTTIPTRLPASSAGTHPVPAELANAGRMLLAAVEAGTRPDRQPGAPDKPPAGHTHKPAPDVRSIQRVVLPGNTDAGWTARYYLEWLGSLLKPLIRIDNNDDNLHRICLRGSRCAILELTYLSERSSAASTVYRISGGVLTKQIFASESRLEFLQLPGSRECIIAIHDYLPSLPWYLYKYTQAGVHLLVMAAFRRHLRRMNSHPDDLQKVFAMGMLQGITKTWDKLVEYLETIKKIR
ncbi:hypothetical protein NST84_04990 [Paenibacillus sp. FSL R7-0345]|uniref:hypothetical protein n=1 Tax=Paenibacillus sp. FSL R7-0345 TaxID=2954535 RepID=UPI00315AF181